MCVIAIWNRGQTITEHTLKDMHNHNKDGCGIAFSSKGIMHLSKGMWSLEELIKNVRHAETTSDGDILLHLRIATHGCKTVDNCHPFRLNHNIAFAHNGTLSQYPEFLQPDQSDSRWFAQILSQLDKLALSINDKDFVSKLEKWHADKNRFAFLCDGKAITTGNWVSFEGIKFSNLNWRKTTVIVHTEHKVTTPNFYTQEIEYLASLTQGMSRKQKKKAVKRYYEHRRDYVSFWQKAQIKV